MQGSYYFLDMDTKAIVKRRRFVELPTPDSILPRIENRGRRYKQNRIIRFSNRNSAPYEWNDERKPLIEDNAPEPPAATFPEIPAETPGVDLEANVPTLESPLRPQEEQQLTAAVKNTGIDDKFEEF